MYLCAQFVCFTCVFSPSNTVRFSQSMYRTCMSSPLSKFIHRSISISFFICILMRQDAYRCLPRKSTVVQALLCSCQSLSDRVTSWQELHKRHAVPRSNYGSGRLRLALLWNCNQKGKFASVFLIIDFPFHPTCIPSLSLVRTQRMSPAGA